MNYVDSLEVELAAAGIPARRRARIVAEFSDHPHENPEARLCAPRDLARQFADELGTRLARGTASCFISAQVALASGGLALLRAWRRAGARVGPIRQPNPAETLSH